MVCPYKHIIPLPCGGVRGGSKKKADTWSAPMVCMLTHFSLCRVGHVLLDKLKQTLYGMF